MIHIGIGVYDKHLSIRKTTAMGDAASANIHRGESTVHEPSIPLKHILFFPPMEEGFPKPTFSHVLKPNPVYVSRCESHVWGPYGRPIPAVATFPPMYYYACIHCSQTLCTEMKIPTTVAGCQHKMIIVSGLGPNYKASKCTQCSYQTCEFIGK